MVTIGVIGAGIYGTNIIRALHQFQTLDGNVELAAIAELDPHRLEERCREYGAQGYTDYREMLAEKELDGVVIATPDSTHRSIAVTCAQAGKHILLEKPMDITISGCREIKEAAEKQGILLEVDFHKRYDPSNRDLFQMIREGRMGRIEYGYCWVEDTVEVPTEWLSDWAKESSPAWFVGIHIYDLIRWLLDEEPSRVYASGIKDKLCELGIDTYDSLHAKIEFEGGASITVDASWILPRGFPAIINQGLRLIGTEGICEIDGQNRGTERVLSDEGRMVTPNHYFMREDTSEGRTSWTGYGIESIRAYVRHLHHLARGGTLDTLEGQYPSAFDGLQATKIAAAVHKSARTNRICEIDT